MVVAIVAKIWGFSPRAGRSRYRRRGLALLFCVVLLAFQTRCLESYECGSGDITCNLEAFLAIYQAVAGCSTASFSTYQGGAGADRIKHIIQTADFGFVAVGQSNQSFGTPLNPHNGVLDLWISRYDRNGNLLWHTYHGSAAADAAEHVTELADGSLLVSGFANGSFGNPINAYAGGMDMVLLKLDANGGLVWNTFFGAAGNDGGGEAIVRPDGLIWYLGVASGALTGNVGTALSPYTGGASMGVAVLVDTNGAVSLHGLLGPGGGTAEFRGGVALANGNGIIIAGQASANFGSPVNAHSGLGDDWYLQVLTNEASPQLGISTFFGAGGADASQQAIELTSGELVVVGRSLNSTGTPINAHSGSNDIAIVKFDGSANRTYNTYHGQAGVDRAFGVVELQDGSLAVAGHSDGSWGSPLSAYTGGIDFALLRLNADGTLASNRFFGSAGTDQAFVLNGTCDGGVVMAGVASGELNGVGVPVNAHTAGTEDAAIIKLTRDQL